MDKNNHVHEYYVKGLLSDLYQDFFIDRGEPIEVHDVGVVRPARIDGVLLFENNEEIAVEIESRVAKQERGAILDILFHKAKKKLFIIVPKHQSNPKLLKDKIEHIFKKLECVSPGSIFKVIVLKGTGHNPKPEEDKEIIRNAVSELRNIV